MIGNIVAIHDKHDANVSFYNRETNKYHIIELERLIKDRHYEFPSSLNLKYEILEDCQFIAKKNWGI